VLLELLEPTVVPATPKNYSLLQFHSQFWQALQLD
jgi:hypothetical protein